MLDAHGSQVAKYLRSSPGLPADEMLNVVELGAGDGRKTSLLLNAIHSAGIDFTYVPIDISSGAMTSLFQGISAEFESSMKMHGVVGEYLEGLNWVRKRWPERRMLVLFLGSTIGNFPSEDAVSFLKNVRGALKTRDLLFAGFDLVKDPTVMLRAYSDSKGLTRDFNLNLLERLNREADASFDPSLFRHVARYNADLRAMESYLVATKEHDVTVCGKVVHFDRDEAICTEYSHKYVPEQAVTMAHDAGFRSVDNFYGFADAAEGHGEPWFLDALFEV